LGKPIQVDGGILIPDDFDEKGGMTYVRVDLGVNLGGYMVPNTSQDQSKVDAFRITQWSPMTAPDKAVLSITSVTRHEGLPVYELDMGDDGIVMLKHFDQGWFSENETSRYLATIPGPIGLEQFQQLGHASRNESLYEWAGPEDVRDVLRKMCFDNFRPPNHR
jgi:hypothetical protein